MMLRKLRNWRLRLIILWNGSKLAWLEIEALRNRLEFANDTVFAVNRARDHLRLQLGAKDETIATLRIDNRNAWREVERLRGLMAGRQMRGQLR